MSAITALPPPKDSRDSGANTATSAKSAPATGPRISAPRPQQRDADTDRPQNEDDRQHRPAQYADAQHRSRGDRDGARLGGAARQGADPGGKAQPDDGSGDAIEHRV